MGSIQPLKYLVVAATVISLLSIPSSLLAQGQELLRTQGPTLSFYVTNTALDTASGLRIDGASLASSAAGNVSVRLISNGNHIFNGGGTVSEAFGTAGSELGRDVQLTQGGIVAASAPGAAGPQSQARQGKIYLTHWSNIYTTSTYAGPFISPTGSTTQILNYPGTAANVEMGTILRAFRSTVGSTTKDFLAASAIGANAVVLYERNPTTGQYFHFFTLQGPSGTDFSRGLDIGDADGDGEADDLIVGLPRIGAGPLNNVGEVRIYNNVANVVPSQNSSCSTTPYPVCTLTENHKITAPNFQPGGQFGYSVAYERPVLLVGAKEYDTSSPSGVKVDSGAAFAYRNTFNSSSYTSIGGFGPGQKAGSVVSLVVVQRVPSTVIDGFVGATELGMGQIQGYRLETSNQQMLWSMISFQNNFLDPLKGATPVQGYPLNGGVQYKVSLNTFTPHPIPSLNGNYFTVKPGYPPIPTGSSPPPASLQLGYLQGCINPSFRGSQYNWTIPTMNKVTYTPPSGPPHSDPVIGKPFAVEAMVTPQTGTNNYLLQYANATNQLAVEFFAGADIQFPSPFPGIPCTMPNDLTWWSWRKMVTTNNFDSQGVMRVTNEFTPSMPSIFGNWVVSYMIWWKDGQGNPVFGAFGQSSLGNAG